MRNGEKSQLVELRKSRGNQSVFIFSDGPSSNIDLFGWAGSSKKGSQDWFRKQQIALTQTKLTMNPNSKIIELRANKNLISN